MQALQQIFREHGPAYLERYGQDMPVRQREVLERILRCKTGDAGHHVFECAGCGHQEVIACGCGDRHCPLCQHYKASEWLDRQNTRMLPCPYFLITFTVPEELRGFLRSHQQAGYEALFESASGALKKLARDRRFVGADQIGFFGVLHTWGRTMQYHPHVHMVVAGGGLTKDRGEWVASRADLFVHVRPLSALYRGKFRAAMEKAGLKEEIDPAVWQKDWNVNSQAVGDGRPTLKYLAAYVRRVGISNSRIVSVKEDSVTFRYEDSDTGKECKMTVTPIEFLRRFLQHVLPEGFVKIRHFGFLSPNATVSLEEIRRLIWMLADLVAAVIPAAEPAVEHPMTCPKCRSQMRWVRFVPALLRTG